MTLAFAEQDQIVGFLYLGTPQRELPPPPDVEGDGFVRNL